MFLLLFIVSFCFCSYMCRGLLVWLQERGWAEPSTICERIWLRQTVECTSMSVASSWCIIVETPIFVMICRWVNYSWSQFVLGQDVLPIGAAKLRLVFPLSGTLSTFGSCTVSSSRAPERGGRVSWMAYTPRELIRGTYRSLYALWLGVTYGVLDRQLWF